MELLQQVRKYCRKEEKLLQKEGKSAQNIDWGYSLEPPLWGGAKEYPQSMFSSKNK